MKGRKRLLNRYDIPLSALRLAEAIIEDYPRRKRVIQYTAAESEMVLDNYRRLNNAIDDVVAGFDPGLSRVILSDIISRKGYSHSLAQDFASKNTYYAHRKKMIIDICERLNIL